MALKVFDLQCENGHVFEGWFASHADYDAQQQRGLMSCPLCNSTQVLKQLSAPRLNMGRHTDVPPTDPRPADMQPTPPANANANAIDQTAAAPAPTQQQMMALQAAVMRQVREIVRKTENVGVRFAQEARRIHEGETNERPIRGVATREEREALAADGIAFMPIPAVFDDERLQ